MIGRHIMSPFLEAAIAVFGPAAGRVAVDAFRSWQESRRPAGYAFVENGEEIRLEFDTNMGLSMPGPGLFRSMYATTFEGTFAAVDEWSFEWLDEDQVVICEIRPLDGEIDALVIAATLADGFVAQLIPGEYRIRSIVFLDDEIDGVGDGWFDIRAGELSFSLEIPIEAVDDRDDVLRLATGARLDEEIGEITGRRVCEWCWQNRDEINSDWKLTSKGKMKCRECGSKDDFYDCGKCGEEWFRRTKKSNYRCTNCDTRIHV